MKGFTLIELMVTIAISSVLFTIGFFSYENYLQGQQLQSAIRQIQADVRSAQEAASASNKPASCGAGVLNNYAFNVVTSSNYTISINCGINTVVLEKSVTMPAGLTLTAPNPNPILFKPLAQGTNIVSGGSAIITVTQASTNATRALTIGSNGSVQ